MNIIATGTDVGGIHGNRVMRMTPLRLLVFILCVALSAAIAVILFPLQAWLETLKTWMADTGPLAVVIFVLAFVIATASISPAAPFSLVAGFLFGDIGLPLALGSATAGGTVAFWLSRYFFRERMLELAMRHHFWKALDRAVAEQGWRVVFLVRLSPLIPFNVQNHMLGLTRIRTAPFVLATLTGIFPNTALAVYVGTLGRTSLSDAGPAALVLPAIGIAGTLLAVFLVSRAARRALLDIMTEHVA